MTGLDIIGDVHGCASMLADRLQDMGYAVDPATGAYRHPERRAVFVGDLVDRGPEQLRVLQIVKAMADSGSAEVVMGNHEFNAIGYSIEHPERPGTFLRKHSERNGEQHAAFLEQLTEAEQQYYLEWFWTLPLWLDLGGVRVVHACWHAPSMKVVEAELGGSRFSSVEQMVLATDGSSDLYEAVEVLLKGPEISLADYGQPGYRDHQKHRRDKARVNWWNQDATTLRELAVIDSSYTTEDFQPYPPLPEIEATARDRSYVYTDDVPVIYGHYWRSDVPVHLDDWTAHTACVDFSAIHSGTLVAYRWDGQSSITLDNYVPHGADVVEQIPAG